MTDDDLLETVRSELAELRLGAPVQDVMARGTALRRHRRMLPAVGTGAGVAVAATGMEALKLGRSVGGVRSQPAADLMGLSARVIGGELARSGGPSPVGTAIADPAHGEDCPVPQGADGRAGG